MGWSRGLTVAALILLFLYLDQAFLKPLVFASLLSFILAPIINVLRLWGIWKAPAVLTTVFAALTLIAILGATLAKQLTDLAVELPEYEATLQDKAKQLSSSSLTSNAFEKASNKLEELGAAIVKHNAETAVKPMQVEILQPEPRDLQSIALLVRPRISPMTMTGLIILFCYSFCLDEKIFEIDLSGWWANRICHGRRWHSMTLAPASAVTFLMQAAINAAFGLAAESPGT